MVLLTLKNLQQQTFTIEIDLSATVKDLKEKIHKEKGADYPVEGQKLIYTGKILLDDQTLETYSMSLSKFIVIMVTKPKASTPEASTSESKESTSTESSEQAKSSSSSTERTVSPAATTAAPTTTSTTSTTTTSDASPSTGAESLLVTGADFENMVTNIMEMGYERPQIEKALRASFNNPYTAVQYLVDGIPEGRERARNEDEGMDDAALAALVESSVRNASDAPAAPAGGNDNLSAESGNLEFLQGHPSFVQMAQLMRTNPQLLDAFLQQIRNTNPSLLQAIQSNPNQFITMLNNATQDQAAGDAPQGEGGAAPANQPGQRTTSIRVSAEDRAAIDRLRALGNFPEDAVLQAYFACEKNENQAAEFLFSQEWEE